ANYTESPLRAFEDETGVQPPVGYWDPLGLASSGNMADFNRRREVEIKHGRVAMFATIGYILPEYWRFPGYLSKYLDIKFADVPNGLSAFSKVPAFGWLQIVGFAGIVEVNIYNEQVNNEPGNYGAGFLGLRSRPPVLRSQKKKPSTPMVRLLAVLAAGALAAQPDGKGGGEPVPEAEREENAKRIPCPFLAGLYQEGILKPDEYGRVNSQHMKEAMMAAGSTIPNAIFPSFGTVRFKEDDLHQTKRHWDYGLIPSGVIDDFGLEKDLSTLWLNIMTMNVPDKCIDAAGHAAMPSKFPCNANPQHVQHGYSTTIRDPRYDAEDPTREKRYKDWIEPTLVKNTTLNATERVMTFEGFTALLARMTVEGDLSGEWSLKPNFEYDGSNVQHYHPHISQVNAEALYHWGPWLAWVGLWEAYGYPYPDGSKEKYMTESDLRRFLLHGKLPLGWSPKPFTLEDVGYTMIALKGHQIPFGDLYSESLAKKFPLTSFLPKVLGTEWRYMRNYADNQRSLGFFLDNIVNPMPGPSALMVCHRRANQIQSLDAKQDVSRTHGSESKSNICPGKFDPRSIGIMNTGITDPEARKKKLNAELANGRLAMFAIIGMFFQDGLTGSAWGDWSLYTASPLRAFEGELGVQAPVGFWDPLGLSADGDAAVFARRREVELKHGRISMFATIGCLAGSFSYIVPEYFRWPGELSPKLGLKFTDIPNGLAALTKVPGQGWGQIVAFLGTYELFINKPVGEEPGNYGEGNLGLGFLGPVADPEARKKKLSAELANGRLAMMAIIGMLFQDGLTGSAWGDWDPALRAKKLNAELANGRLAMMAIIGMFFQDGLTGSAWGDWANYTDSPLRELGVQAPVGFWDPLGLSADGDTEVFKRRREVELKHGRISMYATIGYIVPEYFRWPGELSPKLGL
ncbi:FCPE, partial [Symbiodinium microadriaticum]